MLRKPKAINGTLVLVRVEVSQDFRLGGNRLCCGCKYLFENCVLSGHDKKRQFCLKGHSCNNIKENKICLYLC